MKIEIHLYPSLLRNEQKFTPKYMGYIELPKFDAEKCFSLCNWSDWTESKPTELHSNIQQCGHGVCFTNPETGKKWLAKTFGWLVGTSAEALQYAKENRQSLIWL